MPPSREVQIVTTLRGRIADSDPVALTNLAWFAARRGALTLALEAVRQAARSPDAPPATARALQRLSSGRLDGLFLSVPEKRPGRPTGVPLATTAPFSPADAMLHGRRCLETGRLPEALQAFDLILQRVPSDTPARFHRGVVLAKLRRYAEALQEWERVGRVDLDGPLGAISRRHARSARELAALFTSR